MAGGGDVVVPVSPSGGRRQGHRQKAAWLPLDIIITEIAARSDPATLVRCAATCREARRRVADDPSLGGRLRLRDTGRFVLPLLRGHMTRITTYTRGGGAVAKTDDDVYLVDAAAAAAADSTRLVKASFAAAGAEADVLSNVVPLDSCRGLFLVHATTTTTTTTTNQRQLFVWNPATRRRLVLPPEPPFPEEPGTGRSTDVQYVLLVGDSDSTLAGAGAGAAVGRPFQVLKAKLVLSEKRSSQRRLLVQTFSSEHGAWSSSPCTAEIPTPNLQGSEPSSALQRRPLVVGDDVVHWLCLTDRGSYVLMLHARRVTVTALPASFPRDGKKTHPCPFLYSGSHYQYLLATATAGGNPVVLVADADRISAWEQCKHSRTWKPRPRVVVENETVLRRFMRDKCVPRLEFFGEKSGALLLRIPGCCLLWLDLRTKNILRCFSLERLLYGQVCCAYEMDLASWVPTFSSDVISVE